MLNKLKNYLEEIQMSIRQFMINKVLKHMKYLENSKKILKLDYNNQKKNYVN